MQMYSALKQPKCFSALHWWKKLLQQRPECVILSEHFLHHQFCLAEDGGITDPKKAGNVLVNVGQENKFPISLQL